jgi:hypothetical protein
MRSFRLGVGPCSVKKKNVVKPKEVKTGSNLAESSKERYGSKSVILPMIMNKYASGANA